MDAATFSASSGWEKVYKYQKNGERRDMTPTEATAVDGWARINKYPVCRTVSVGGWDDANLADEWRKGWDCDYYEVCFPDWEGHKQGKEEP